MRATPQATPPPNPALFVGLDDGDDELESAEGGIVDIIMFVVVWRLPSVVMMEVTEMTLTRLVGDCFAAPPPALLAVDVVDEEADVDEGIVEVDVGDDDGDEVEAGV